MPPEMTGDTNELQQQTTTVPSYSHQVELHVSCQYWPITGARVCIPF